MIQYSKTAEKRLCPACGQVLPEGAKAYINGNFLFFEGERIRLSPKEKLIMQELVDGFENGYNVTPDHLISRAWSESDKFPRHPRNALSVYINNLRYKFRNTNIRITNEYNIYRLSFI